MESFLHVWSLCVLFVIVLPSQYITDGQHNIEKRSKGAVAFSILDFTISKTIDIASLIDDKSKWADIEKTMKDIKTQLDHATTRLTSIEKLLKELKRKLDYSDYDRVITDAQREISNCFDYVGPLYNTSSNQQARVELETCNPRQKAYAKQIGDILTGKPIGTHNKLLFDQLIYDTGFCNGTEILNLREYLSVLFVKGCSVMIIGEYLIHGNTSSFIDQNYCTRSLQEMSGYQETLYDRCASESEDTRSKVFQEILTNTGTVEQAFFILNSTFPWFKFFLIKSECSDECKIEPFGKDNCKIRTFTGKSGEYYILMYDMKQSDTTENGDLFGIQIRKSCVQSEKSDGFSTSIRGLPIAAYYDYRNRPDKETCAKAETKCPGLSSGTRIIKVSTIFLFMVTCICSVI